MSSERESSSENRADNQAILSILYHFEGPLDFTMNNLKNFPFA